MLMQTPAQRSMIRLVGESDSYLRLTFHSCKTPTTFLSCKYFYLSSCRVGGGIESDMGIWRQGFQINITGPSLICPLAGKVQIIKGAFLTQGLNSTLDLPDGSKFQTHAIRT